MPRNIRYKNKTVTGNITLNGRLTVKGTIRYQGVADEDSSRNANVNNVFKTVGRLMAKKGSNKSFSSHNRVERSREEFQGKVDACGRCGFI